MIISISWVRNEEDIIEWFVRHNTRFVDRMIVIDNGSDDRTSAILHVLQQEGFHIDIHHDPTPIHRQDEALTALLAECSALCADWILPLDADEFLCMMPGRDLFSLLSDMPRDRVTLLPWRTYVPTVEDDPREPNPARRIRFRRDPEHPLFYKILAPESLASLPGMRIAPGSHALLHKEGSPLQTAVVEHLWLAHIPVRSVAQISRKILESWPRHCANPTRNHGDMYHWRDLYEKFTVTATLDNKKLTQIARMYAASPGDPLPAIILDPIASSPLPEQEPRAAFLVLWLGPLPPTTDLFLASCRHNPNFTWLLITDQDAPLSCPPNVRYVSTTAEKLTARFHEIIGADITIPPAYRLCDLRPTFGEVFTVELQEFSHWGHCDLDVLWGDIGRFFTPERLRTCDVLSADAAWICGPCALYRRTPRLTTLWRLLPNYRTILTAPMNPRQRTVEETDFARLIARQPDLRTFSTHAQCSCFDTTTASWRNGRLWRSDGTEALLMHLFQWKRLPIDPPNLHRLPTWQIDARGLRPAPPHAGTPRRRTERHGILTMATPATLPALLRLAGTLHRQRERRISVFSCGLHPMQILRCLLHGIRVLPLPRTGTMLPALLRASPFPITLWLDPRCIVLRPLSDLWTLLQGRPHAALERTMGSDGSLCFLDEQKPSLAMIGVVPSRGRDRDMLAAWEEEIVAGADPRMGFLLALQRCESDWIIAHNGEWLTRCPTPQHSHAHGNLPILLRELSPAIRIAMLHAECIGGNEEFAYIRQRAACAPAIPGRSSSAPPKSHPPGTSRFPAAPQSNS